MNKKLMTLVLVKPSPVRSVDVATFLGYS